MLVSLCHFLTLVRSTCTGWPGIRYWRQRGSWRRWTSRRAGSRRASWDEAERYTTWRAGWTPDDSRSSQEVTCCPSPAADIPQTAGQIRRGGRRGKPVWCLCGLKNTWSILNMFSMCDIILTHIHTTVKLRPPQSHRLNSRKQLTGMKYCSVNNNKSNHTESSCIITMVTHRWSWDDSPQEPPSARVDLTSAVMAGNIPMVMVKVKQTDTASNQIWRPKVTSS